jgi:hypothetical protein
MRKILVLAGFGAILILSLSIRISGFPPTEVSGRIVSTGGQPVPRGSIFLLPRSEKGESPDDQLDSNYYSITADNRGLFEGTFDFSGAIMCTTYPTTAGKFEPLSASYLCGHSNGRIIRNTNGKPLRLGAVQISYNYQLITLKLTGGQDQPAFSKALSNSKLWVRLSAADHFRVVTLSVPREYVSVEDCSLGIYLPEGRWNLAFTISEEPEEWSCNIPISVPSRHTDTPNVVQANIAFDACRVQLSPRVAREKLRQMSVDYTDESFRQRVADGNGEIVRLFIDSGFDITNASPANEPLLLDGADYPEVVSLLLKKGVDPNSVSPEGLSPVMAAALQGSVGSVKRLINAGAGLNAQNNAGMTALMFAVENNREDIVKILISAGASTTSRDFEGNTALEIAVEAGFNEIADLIREARANGDKP